MQLNNYQVWTRTTAIYPGAGKGELPELSYLALGLASEAGEVAGKIKKYQRDGGLDRLALSAELGDCFWYLCRLADAIGQESETILESNYLKLEDRKKRNVLQGNGDTR